MSLILPQTCNMGSSQTGLVGIIGVTLLNPDGTVKTARTTAGIYEIGGGAYGKNIGFDDHWIGLIVWDTGGANPYYAVTEYNLEGLSDAILEDTNELQTNQGNWLTATGFSVPNEYDTELSNIQAEVNGLDGEAMRGTDLAAKASVCTEARLAELDAANLPADVDAIKEDTTYLKKTVDNDRSLKKVGNSWYLIIYDNDGVTELINKKLTDKNDADILDIATGILAREAANSV